MATMIDQMVEHDLFPGGIQADGYAPEWAEYKHALRRVAALMGLTQDGSRPGGGLTPLSDLDEAAVTLVTAAWLSGTRVGDAFARAELTSLDAAPRVCARCHGYGRRTGDARDCEVCRGTGLVAGNQGG